MAAGDLTIPVQATGTLPDHGTVLATSDTAVLEAGPEPTIGAGDLLAVLTSRPVPALPPFGVHVETLRTGRYF